MSGNVPRYRGDFPTTVGEINHERQIIVLVPYRADVANTSIDNSADYVKHDVFGVTFELHNRYRGPIEPLGRGGYGYVGSAHFAGSNQKVAVKKIPNAFRNLPDARRVIREIIIQRHMEHPNIASVRDVLLPPVPSRFQDVYVVYDLMPSDLQQIIQSNQTLTENHYRHILVQILRALKYMQSANVLHRDLKPSNILIDGRCNVKVTDFGLSRTRLGVEEHMTEYVVTRWYRAPELLLNCPQHSAPVDMWSVGCIYMELMTRSVFFKGRDRVDQLKKILEVIGTPHESELEFLDDDSRRFILMQVFPRRPLIEICPQLTPLGADLAQRMLAFDPSRRITVEEALAHPYLAANRKTPREFICPTPLEIDLSFEHEHYTVDVIKQLLYEIAMEFTRTLNAQ